MGYFSNGSEGEDYFEKWCAPLGHASDYRALHASNTGRRVPSGAYRLCVVKFNYLPVVHVCTECPLNRVHIGTQRV